MATIDDTISIHPKRIRALDEVDAIIFKIENYEKMLNCNAGVALRQNMQLGSSYIIVSENEANEGLNRPRKFEWYASFFPKSYFENLREKLKN
ncbi:hypothetical protein J4468_03875 [Candidatus Woesearchaeota archaeon]|nr:hypothetical protein [Candidatus Woesearchaeota archaeon]